MAVNLRRNAAVQSAGRSATREYRTRTGQWRTAPLPVTFAVAGALAILAGTAGLAASRTVGLTAAVVAFAVPLVARQVLRRPQAALSLGAGFLWVVSIPYLGLAIAADRSVSEPDPVSAFLALIALALLTAILAYRAPLGRPWLTILTGLSGYWLGVLIAFSQYPGTAWLFGLAGLGLALSFRYGLRAYLAHVWQQGVDTIRRWAGGVPDDIELWRGGAQAERRTALILDKWRRGQDGQATVLHDRDIPRHDELGNVDHLVVSRRGIAVVDSAARVTAVHADGSIDGQTDSGSGPAATARRAAALADLLGVPVRGIIVEHRAEIDGQVVRVPVEDGEVAIVRPDGLSTELTAAPADELTDRQVKRIVRRARRYLRPAGNGKAEKQSRKDGKGAASTPVDTARSARGSKPSTSGPIAPGRRVMLMSDDGVFCDMRAATGVMDGPDGTPVVYICGEAEWYAAGRENRTPEIKPWPVERVSVE